MIEVEVRDVGGEDLSTLIGLWWANTETVKTLQLSERNHFYRSYCMHKRHTIEITVVPHRSKVHTLHNMRSRVNEI